MERSISRRYSGVIIQSIILTIISSALVSHASILKDNDKIIFLGDSITRLGDHTGGFINLFERSIKRNHKGSHIKVIASGVSGDTILNLNRRLHRDVLRKRPKVVVVFIGVNDVWNHGKAIPKASFKNALHILVRRIKSVGSQVVLVTPTLRGERHITPFSRLLKEYTAIIKYVGKRTRTQVVDVHYRFLNYLRRHNRANHNRGVLTHDSVHLNNRGNYLVATMILRALGEKQN